MSDDQKPVRLGRPRKNHGREPHTTLFDKEKWETLKARALEQGRQVHDLIDEALTAYLEK